MSKKIEAWAVEQFHDGDPCGIVGVYTDRERAIRKSKRFLPHNVNIELVPVYLD